MLNKLRPWAVPFGLLVVLVASFGLLIPWLGFYWDDWSVLMTARMRGISGFWEYYAYDRPFSAWTYVVFMPILKTNPITWQIFSLLLRWGTAACFWIALGNLWPKHQREAVLAAFLFAIYPIFDQQAISVAFSQHWICYFLYCLSIALMILAWRKKGPIAWLLTLCAVLAAGLQIFTLEYFVGLELLRPFLLWILVSERKETRLRTASTILVRWLPYLLAMTIFVLWRLFFLKLPAPDPNTPSLLFNFFAAPLKVATHLLQLALQDIGFMLITVWANLFKAENIQLDDRFILFSWALAAAVATGLFFFLQRMLKDETSTPAPQGRWTWPVQAAGIGIISILCGMLPIWLTDRQVMVGMHSDRFGMPAMLGASLLVVAFISWLGISQTKRLLFICLLVGMAAGAHLRTSNDYRWAWVSQSRFYWQMAWRAPSIQPNTSIFAEGEFLSYMSGNAITTGIDLLYAPPKNPTYILPYYFYSLGRYYGYRMPDFLSGIPTQENSYRIYHFNGNTRDALVIDYSPADNNCLHVLSSQDGNMPGLPPLTSKALVNSNLSLIQSGPTQSGYPPADIFGPQPDLPWCHIYQQAELARQMGNWQQVNSLAEQAIQKGFSLKNGSSNTPYEWLPFIEGYARTGHLDSAKQLSEDILAKNKLMSVRLCELWSKIHDDMPKSDFSSVLTTLGCSK
jgi:hypothetical protein